MIYLLLTLSLTPSYFPDLALGRDDEPSLSMAEFDDHWGIVIDFGDVRPGDDVWTDGNLFVGSTPSRNHKPSRRA